MTQCGKNNAILSDFRLKNSNVIILFLLPLYFSYYLYITKWDVNGIFGIIYHSVLILRQI